MIVVLVVVLALPWLEKEVPGHHLKNCTGEGPDIGRGVIVGTDNYLRRSVLARLDFRGEMVMRPTAIAHVTDLDHDCLVDLATSLGELLLELLLHFFDRLGGLQDHSLLTLIPRRLLSLFRSLLRRLRGLVDVNIDIVDVSLSIQRLIPLRIAVIGVRGLHNLGVLLLLLILASLSLELLAQIFLLLRAEAFEETLIPDLIGCAGALDVALLFLLLLLLLLGLLPLYALHSLTEVVAQSASYLHIQVLDMLVLAHLGGGQLACFGYLFDFVIPETNDYILGLEIGVDDLAHAVHVIQANQALSRQSPHQRQRHAAVVIALDDFEEVDAQDFEDHDEVLAIGSMVDEGVQQLGAVRAL